MLTFSINTAQHQRKKVSLNFTHTVSSSFYLAFTFWDSVRKFTLTPEDVPENPIFLFMLHLSPVPAQPNNPSLRFDPNQGDKVPMKI